MTRAAELRPRRAGGARHRRVERHRPPSRRAPRRRRSQGGARRAASRPPRRGWPRDRGGRRTVPADRLRRHPVRQRRRRASPRPRPSSGRCRSSSTMPASSSPSRCCEHTEEDWDYVVDTNLKGAWLMAREFAQHLVERQRPGRIVNIASVLGVRTIGRVPSYTAAKAGLIHLTHVLAMELARYGILVNAIAPGYVETDFNRDSSALRGRQNARSRASRCAGRAGPTISTARCCCWPRRRAPISPAR